MFYLIGLGLELESISKEAFEICKKARKIYLENYTIKFPYDLKELGKFLGKEIIELKRGEVEKEEFLGEAKEKDIVLLVYGSPLMATTHISLILKCKEEKIDFRIIHNASVFDAIAETGLQIYKFGKTASMPAWTENYKPSSFAEIIKENEKIKSHSLILVDIGLKSKDALNQLEEACKIKKKIAIGSNLGTKQQKIYYSEIKDLKQKSIKEPFCIIIPSDLHFLEKEFLEKV